VLAGTGALASTLGLLLPWLLSGPGTDPAFGSGPLAPSVQHVLTRVIHFGCVAAIVL
jgi:magnesium transporter